MCRSGWNGRQLGRPARRQLATSELTKRHQDKRTWQKEAGREGSRPGEVDAELIGVDGPQYVVRQLFTHVITLLLAAGQQNMLLLLRPGASAGLVQARPLAQHVVQAGAAQQGRPAPLRTTHHARENEGLCFGVPVKVCCVSDACNVQGGAGGQLRSALLAVSSTWRVPRRRG